VSRDLSGQFVSRPTGKVGCERDTTAEDQALHLELSPSGSAGEDAELLAGRLDVSDLRQIARAADKGAGLQYGRFRFTSDAMEAVGTVAGLTSLGTHGPEVSACAEPRRVPGHQELSLQGTVVRGKQAGARVRAVLALDLGAGAAGQTATSVAGTMEGVVEKSCSLSAREVQRRVEQAQAQASRPWTPPCNGRLPCLKRIAKKGKGRIVLDQTGRDQCREGACPVLKTWSRMEVALAGVPGFEGTQPFLGDGVLRLSRFVQVLGRSGEGRGEHGGRFAYRTKDGVWVRGEMYGITRAGTHRRPLARACEQPLEKDHSEGRLVGVVLNGPHKGAVVEARYVLRVSREKGRRQGVALSLEGWGMKGCVTRAATAALAAPPPTTVSAPAAGSPHPRVPSTALPEPDFRPLSQIPADVVERFTRAEGGQLSPESERRLRTFDRRFRDLDVDKSGTLSAQELRPRPAAPSGDQPGKLPADPLVAWYRAHFDRNKDGIITEAEAGTAWGNLKQLDGNGDGRLVAVELRRARETADARAFSQADSNRDLLVDLGEYVLWVRTLPRVRRGPRP
jgi:hypothetical protein